MGHSCDSCGVSKSELGWSCDKCSQEALICGRCAEDKQKYPACEMCQEGCQDCPIVGKDSDRGNNYDDFEECPYEDCPLSRAFQGENHCESCFSDLAKNCDVDPNYGGEHETWTFAECGHETCAAFQENEDLDHDVCFNCKADENEKATKENANVEVEKEAKDTPLILDYISTLSSKSGKDVLLLWVKDHPEACATAQAAAIKCSGKQPRAPPFKKSMATKRKKEENKATNKRKAKK
jgi:hypothetical protein